VGKLRDLFQIQVGTSGEPEPPSALVTCPQCGHDGIPGYGQRSKQWMIVHLAGCSRETVTGESRDEVSRLWKEQNG
jgi:hypothetical protein